MLPRKELERLTLTCDATEMTTQMLFRHCIRIASRKQKSAEKRFSALRIIRNFTTVQTAKNIHRAAGLGGGLGLCLIGENQSVAQLHFEKKT
jgi:hypothetical protein